MLGAMLGAASGFAGGAVNGQKAVDRAAETMNEQSGAEATIRTALQQRENLQKSAKAMENKSVIDNYNAGKRNAEAIAF